MSACEQKGSGQWAEGWQRSPRPRLVEQKHEAASWCPRAWGRALRCRAPSGSAAPVLGAWPSFDKWAPFRTREVNSLAQSHTALSCPLSPPDPEPVLIKTFAKTWKWVHVTLQQATGSQCHCPPGLPGREFLLIPPRLCQCEFSTSKALLASCSSWWKPKHSSKLSLK